MSLAVATALALLLAAAPKTTNVRVRCPEDCTVKVDGKSGFRIDARNWEVKDVPSGTRRIEASSTLSSIYNGYSDLPPGDVNVVIDAEKKRATVTKSSTPKNYTEKDISTVIVRCPEDCNVTIDGRRGRKLENRRYQVEGLMPGSRRVDITAKFNRTLYTGYLELPARSELTVLVDSSRNLTVQETKKLGAAK